MKKQKETKKIYVILFLAFILALVTALPQTLRAAEDEKEIFDNARLALFDRQWDKALSALDRLTRLYPETIYYSQALFYKGECYKEKKDFPKALEYFNTFVKVSKNEELKEEALSSIIDLNYRLYEEGDPKAVLKILDLLESKQIMVRYYAAFKLSYVRNKKVAKRAVPVLKKITRVESDESLVDRAKIALMRIDPQYLKKESEPKSLENAMLVIRAYNKEEKKEIFNFTFPFSLAKLALDSIPDDVKEELEEEGKDIDIDKILSTITRTRQFVRIEAEGFFMEIGIE